MIATLAGVLILGGAPAARAEAPFDALDTRGRRIQLGLRNRVGFDSGLGRAISTHVLEADAVFTPYTDEFTSTISLQLPVKSDFDQLSGNLAVGFGLLYERDTPFGEHIRFTTGVDVFFPTHSPFEADDAQRRRLAGLVDGPDRSLLWVPTRDLGYRLRGDYFVLFGTQGKMRFEYRASAHVGWAMVATNLLRRPATVGGLSMGFGIDCSELLDTWALRFGLEARGALGNEWTPDDIVPLQGLVTASLWRGWLAAELTSGLAITSLRESEAIAVVGLDLKFALDQLLLEELLDGP